MRLLLDTHTFLWWIADHPSLSKRARVLLADASNQLFLSAVSGWEIAIKAQLGKLPLPEDPRVFVSRHMGINGILPLSIEMRHVLRVYSLPLHHRDPFDRLLIAQSDMEGMTLVTADHAFDPYGVDIAW